MSQKVEPHLSTKSNINKAHLAYQEVHSHTAGNSSPLCSFVLGLEATGMHQSSSPLPTATKDKRPLSVKAMDTSHM